MADATTQMAPPTPPKKHAVDLQEVQETVSRLATHKGVTAVLILNSSGDIVTQSGGGDGAVGNTKLLAKMLQAANIYVSSMPRHKEDEEEDNHDAEGGDGQDGMDGLRMMISQKKSEEKISFLRIRTQRDEILVASKLSYTLVVLQDPSVSSL
jgi:hypothetical protein